MLLLLPLRTRPSRSSRLWRRCSDLTSLHPPPSLTPAQQQHALILKARAAERARFGLTVWQLLGAGLVGVGLAFQWWSESFLPRRDDARHHLTLPAAGAVLSHEEAHALLVDVRLALERHGIGLGHARLPVHVAPDLMGREGSVVKEHGARHTRRVRSIRLQPGLDAMRASHVLAHEFMRAWLWLQGFPEMDSHTEEGLCELVAYLYLLSSLREPREGAAMQCTEAELRHQIYTIEASMHSPSKAGFRRTIESLRGRKLHDLLSFVRQHGHLPPPLPPGTLGLGFDELV